jgi:hypothetical protein
VQRRCLSIMGIVACSCSPMVNLRTERSPGARRHVDQGHIIGSMWCPCIIEMFMFSSLSLLLSLLNFKYFMFNQVL